MFDINVIDLNGSKIWECDESNFSNLRIQNDLCTLKSAILTCSTKVVIILPMNQLFKYNKNYDGKLLKQIELKNITGQLVPLLEKNIIVPFPSFDYEKCETTINKFIYDSDFYFNSITENVLTKSDKSNKVNTFRNNNVIFTTLNILNYLDELTLKTHLDNFIFNFCNEKEDLIIPEWAKEINFYDDLTQKNKIKELNKQIQELNLMISYSNNILTNNNKIKSILYSSGKILSDEINDILKDIFEITNDSFTDVYEEDYILKMDGITFIIETKGLTKEVAGKNVSDAYDHLVIYEDKLEQEGIEENTKCLFFVASERNKPICERKEINNRQVTIAKRNNTLIVDTYSFYKIYEDFKNKRITKEDILKIFQEQIGIIDYKK